MKKLLSLKNLVPRRGSPHKRRQQEHEKWQLQEVEAQLRRAEEEAQLQRAEAERQRAIDQAEVVRLVTERAAAQKAAAEVKRVATGKQAPPHISNQGATEVWRRRRGGAG